MRAVYSLVQKRPTRVVVINNIVFTGQRGRTSYSINYETVPMTILNWLCLNTFRANQEVEIMLNPNVTSKCLKLRNLNINFFTLTVVIQDMLCQVTLQYDMVAYQDLQEMTNQANNLPPPHQKLLSCFVCLEVNKNMRWVQLKDLGLVKLVQQERNRLNIGYITHGRFILQLQVNKNMRWVQLSWSNKKETDLTQVT